MCQVCEQKAASVYCRNDKAYLCSGCNDSCHAGLPLKHTIVPAAQAVKEGIDMIAEMADDSSPDHSACGESSPNPAAAAPAVGTKRRISQDSAQRVPECDTGAVPPGLDFELPKGPMDRQALAKTLWGKEFDALDMDNTWLDRLDMGLDFNELLTEDLQGGGAGAFNDADGLVPCLSADNSSPTAAQLEQQLSASPARGAGKQQQHDAAALATLERQTTDEFFAALADDFAVPSLPSAHEAAPAVVPMAPPMVHHYAPQQMMGMVHAYPQQMMYVPTNNTMPMQMAPMQQQQQLNAYAPAAAAAAPAPLAKRQRLSAARDVESDDDSDDDWCQEEEMATAVPASGRLGASRSASAAAALTAAALPASAAALAAPGAAASVIDNLTREQRVARYREKRKNRQFKKTIRYASRKAYAEVRPRIKGRFATKQEIEAWKAAERAMAAGSAAMGIEAFFAAQEAAAAGGAPEALGVVPVM